METKGNFISQVKHQLKIMNADYKLPNKLIWGIIEKHAFWLLKEDGDKLRTIRNNTIFQTWKCVDIEEAPSIDDCCGIRSRCSVNRTICKSPELYEDSDGVIIKTIYTIDGSMEFTSITIQEYMRKLENPNSKYDKTHYFYYNNGWFYFPKSSIRKVMIKGLFKEDIDKYNQCDDKNNINSCKSKLEENFNFPPYLYGRLMDAVLKDLSMNRQIQNDPQMNKIENQ